ncbi:single-stranded-DNA-specific exonuclease RecJ [Patescibacteria group bacterium]|nr:single-stranded-DNA-specific exonuclease RecJ [Patescibacteria group bacterium]
MQKSWIASESCPPEQRALYGELPSVAATVLWSRGYRTTEDIERFLHPTWEAHVHDPSQFRHLQQAMARVFTALEQGETVTIHGDYDADGVTGSTVLISTLRELEKKLGKTETCVDYYIPHRDKEGYGLHVKTVDTLKERGTKVIITVDCGIACVPEIAAARAHGIDVIVVDHHQFGETLPDAWLIHPGLPEETYPFKQLAAVGVAFKFATALLEEGRRRGLEIPSGWEKWLLDLVSIATVTDMVPLVGENRVLEHFGLKVLNKTRRPGLRALIEAASLEDSELTSESIGFAIGPRINAAGRMDHASLALDLLLAESPEVAKAKAAELERCNRTRQEETRKMMTEADAQLLTRGMTEERIASPEGEKVIVLWDKRWSPALVGLVAGRLLERYGRPVVAIGHHEGQWIGSGRSISSYNITEAMRTAGEGILTRSGGHVQACGFALVEEERLLELAKKVEAHGAERLTPQDLVPTRIYEAEIALREVNAYLIQTLEQFEPFGQGNPKPLFCSRNVLVTAIAAMGTEGRHLRMTVSESGGSFLKMVGFGMGARISDLKVGSHLDLLYQVSMNKWNGREEPQGMLVDLCVS